MEAEQRANLLVKAWQADTALANAPLPHTHLLRMAQIAVRQLGRLLPEFEDKPIVDTVTGLQLPPQPQKFYQQRGRNPQGRRFTIEEHLADAYPLYAKNHLLFSGHLKEIDRPAYEALLYRAKQAVANGSTYKTIADYYLACGVLSADHLDVVPEGLERQAALIRRVRALRMANNILERVADSSR